MSRICSIGSLRSTGSTGSTGSLRRASVFRRPKEREASLLRARWLRAIAWGTATVFAWMAAAPAVLAATAPDPAKAPQTRTLAPEEMAHIRGTQMAGGGEGLIHFPSIADESGSTYPWEGEHNNTNTGNGNKLTTIPIVGWTARGGMPVSVSLAHNSQSTHNSELGHKWTHSYDIYALIDATPGDFTVHWGDDLSYTFTKNMDGSFTAPTGIFDTLVYDSAASKYTLTKKNQVKYAFTEITGVGWYCNTIEDRNSNTITIAHNNSGFVTSVTDPTSRAVSFTYTSGKITSITDPLSRTWTLSYTGDDLTRIELPTVNSANYDLEFAYSTAHNILTLTDARGKNWTFTYNTDSSLASETNPLSHTTTYTYSFGQTTITDANGKTIYHNYDTSTGRLSSVKDAANYTEYYTYNSSNLVTRRTDRRGEWWDYTYDSMGNMLTRKNPLLQTWTYTYNAKNDVLTETTPLGNEVVYTYDTAGNLTAVDKENSSSAVLFSEDYTVNSNGLVTRKTLGNGHYVDYGYNAHGDLTSVTTKEGHITLLGYNALGVRTSRTDALSRTTNYTLDNWNRITTVDYPAGTDHTFTYDANSNLTQFVDATGTTTRTYDDLNRLTAETKGGSTVVSYTYDDTGEKGQLSVLTDAGGRTLSYNYTARYQISSVTESGSPGGTTSYTYDGNGNVTNISYPTGVHAVKTFDDANRLTAVSHVKYFPFYTTLSSFSYGYDDENRRTSVTETSTGTGSSTVSYGYDGASRLTSESRTGTGSYNITYTLDAANNRTSQTVGGVTTTLSYNDDEELTGTSGGFTNSYTYNANGEQTARTLGGTAYTLSYDYDGQLTSIVQGGSTTSFAYDALGRRTSRTAGGVTTEFQRAGDTNGGIVLREKQGSTVTATYMYGNELIRKDSEYMLYDGLGSTRTVTDGSGSVTRSVAYDVFGQQVASSGSSGSPYLFAATSGYRGDGGSGGDAGLLHVGARYYDAQVGRFTTRDSYLSEHPYVYCDGDPVNYTDPSGHDPDDQQGGKPPKPPKLESVQIPIFVIAGYVFGIVIQPIHDELPDLGWYFEKPVYKSGGVSVKPGAKDTGNDPTATLKLEIKTDFLNRLFRW